MITKIVMILLTFSTFASASKITDELCDGNPNCLLCLDSGQFAKCENKPIFDKDILVSENPLIYGGTNTNIRKPICPLKKVACNERKETITIEAEEVFEGEYPFGGNALLYRTVSLLESLTNQTMNINTYCYEWEGNNDSGGYQWKKCVKAVKHSLVIVFDEPYQNCTTGDGGGCDWDRVKPAMKTLTTSYSDAINVSTNEIGLHASWVENIPIDTFCYEYVGSGDGGGYTFVPCKVDVESPLNWSFTPTLQGEYLSSTVESTPYSFSPVRYKYTVRTARKKIQNNWECPIDNNLSCMEDGGAYYCSNQPCSTIQEDDDVSTDIDDQTPKDDGATDDNGACLENLYIFPGKTIDCKQSSKDGIQPDCCKMTKTEGEIKDKLVKGATALYAVFPVFSPVFLSYFQSAMGAFFDLFINSCTEMELQLSTMRGSYGVDGNCQYVGKVCQNYFGVSGSFMGSSFDNTFCSRAKEIYCCYDSVIAKSFNTAARRQLGIGWGSVIYKEKRTQYIPPTPNCRGLKLEELLKLNMSDPAITEEMKNYFMQVTLKELNTAGGALDPQKIIDMQNKLINDINNQFK